MYDPQLMRFTGRDPVRGKYSEPLTLHRYLYCNNNSINMVDPDGRVAVSLAGWVVFKGLVGGTIGAVSSYKGSKTHRLRAAFFGFASGAIAANAGVYTSLLAGIGNALHISHNNNEDDMLTGRRWITTTVTGGLGGLVGTLFPGSSDLGVFLGASVINFLSGEAIDDLWDSILGVGRRSNDRFE